MNDSADACGRGVRDVEVPVYDRIDLEIVSGEGMVVRDAAGRDYLDFYGGHAVTLLGQAHPVLLEALAEQARRLFFQTNLVELEVRRQAARRLVDFAPEGIRRAFLVSTGAEANENALRLAFRQTKRRKAVALVGGFHGRTAAAAAVTWNASRWYGFPERPFETLFVEAGDVSALDRAIDGDTACFIVEAVQGLGGAKDLPLDYLRTAASLCRDRGAFFIADEIQCGMGRCGRPFAIERAGVRPDLITVAKGLAGGLPAAALLTTEEAIKGIGPGDLGTTFGGGPLPCALIPVVIDLIESEGLMAKAAQAESLVRETCVRGPVRSVQGAGALLGLRVEGPAKPVIAALRDKGILVGGASDPSVLRLMPPLIVGAAEIAKLAAALEEIGPR